MNREPLKNGTVLRFPDGQEHEIIGLLGGGGSALLYETRILGSELYAAVKEIYPARGYVRRDGLICPAARLPRRERELQRRKSALVEQETRLSQKASRKNYQVLFLQPPVWHKADLRLPDGTELPNVENTYVRMDSLAGKGISLSQLAGGEHSLDDTLEIMETVLDAYAALHEDGFLHGDCQMSNLFLLKAGRGGEGPGTACIIDFGSARELGADGLTEPITDEIFSTDGYCAPELMFPRGDELRLSAAADVWSLGFLLLNLLTGRDWSGVDGLTGYLMCHPEEKLLTAEEAAALGCTPAQEDLLKIILSRALADDPAPAPEGRFSDAGEMRKVLRELSRCRRKDPSGGLTHHLLWDAAWRHRQDNPSLFQTEHVFRLAKGVEPRSINVKGRYRGGKPIPAGWILQGMEQDGENAYLFGAGGSGKSFAAAHQVARLTKSRERIPLYLNLAAFTAQVLERCGGDESKVIPTLLAGQYFGRTDLGEELDALLGGGRKYFLLLDDLHKVENSALPAAIAALNGMKERWSNVWVLVLGRAKKPGVESLKNHSADREPELPRGNLVARLKRMLAEMNDDDFDDEFDFHFDHDDEDGDRAAWRKTSGHRLNLRHVELQPLTTEEMLAQVRTVRREGLDFAAGTSLLKQEQTLRLPLFLMRYLELLALSGEEDSLPNGAMELLHGYFALQEYRGGSREHHDLLREQLPWVAYQYGRLNRAACTAEEITVWLRERFGQEVDTDGFFRRSVDELAVLECDGWGEYRLVHDCYQEYFAALFGANCIRETVVRRSAEPLKAAVWEWDEEMVGRCLELCCLTVRDGKVVRTRSESEVLRELGNVLVKLRRRELRSLGDLMAVISRHGIISPEIRADDPDGALAFLWSKVHLRSLFGLPRLACLLGAVPAFLLFSRKNSTGFWLRTMSLATEDGKAEYELAARYNNGIDVRADPEKAQKYLDRAVKKGYAPALNAKGENEEAAGRYKEAMELYQQAADKQYPRAVWHVGWLHLNALGVPRNVSRATRLFEQAARSGDPQAQLSYAQLLERGVNGRDEVAETLYWYDKAAAQGVEPAKEAAQRLRAAQNRETTE